MRLVGERGPESEDSGRVWGLMMMTSFEEFIVGTLCVWRVTHLFQSEDGPALVLVRMRRAAGRVIGQLLDCFYCLSLWVAAPAAAALSTGWKNGMLLWLAMSGAACLLERATRERDPFAGLVHEDPKEESHVLRQSETTDFDEVAAR
jgi:hypothetical protein